MKGLCILAFYGVILLTVATQGDSSCPLGPEGAECASSLLQKKEILSQMDPGISSGFVEEDLSATLHEPAFQYSAPWSSVPRDKPLEYI